MSRTYFGLNRPFSERSFFFLFTLVALKSKHVAEGIQWNITYVFNCKCIYLELYKQRTPTKLKHFTLWNYLRYATCLIYCIHAEQFLVSVRHTDSSFTELLNMT